MAVQTVNVFTAALAAAKSVTWTSTKNTPADWRELDWIKTTKKTWLLEKKL